MLGQVWAGIQVNSHSRARTCCKGRVGTAQACASHALEITPLVVIDYQQRGNVMSSKGNSSIRRCAVTLLT